MTLAVRGATAAGSSSRPSSSDPDEDLLAWRIVGTGMPSRAARASVLFHGVAGLVEAAQTGPAKAAMPWVRAARASWPWAGPPPPQPRTAAGPRRGSPYQ